MTLCKPTRKSVKKLFLDQSYPKTKQFLEVALVSAVMGSGFVLVVGVAFTFPIFSSV